MSRYNPVPFRPQESKINDVIEFCSTLRVIFDTHIGNNGEPFATRDAVQGALDELRRRHPMRVAGLTVKDIARNR